MEPDQHALVKLHSTPSHFRTDIEALRGVAVLAVLLFHVDPLAFPAGFVGVDAFFVISGWVVTQLLVRQYRTQQLSLFGFFTNRMKRLAPAATLVVVLVLLYSCIDTNMGAWRRQAIAKDAVFVTTMIANERMRMVSDDYFDKETLPSPFLHYWSLAVEEQYYIIFAPVLALTLKHGGKKSFSGFIGITAVASLWISVYLTKADPGRAFYSLISRWWEFAAGVGVAVIEKQWPFMSLPAAASMVAAMLFTPAVHFPGIGAIPIVLSTAALIASGESGMVNDWLSHSSTLRFLGKISYSVYLWHWPLLTMLHFQHSMSAIRLIYLAAVCAIPATLSGVIVETWGRRHVNTKRGGCAVGLGCTILSLAMAAWSLYAMPQPTLPPLPKLPGTANEIITLIQATQPQGTFVGTFPQPQEAPYDAVLHERGRLVVGNTSEHATTVFMPGDSHASRNVFPGVHRFVKFKGWRLILSYWNACPFPQQLYGNIATSDGCESYRQSDWHFIRTTRPAFVITSNSEVADPAHTYTAYSETANTLQASNTRFIVIQDNPHTTKHTAHIRTKQQVIYEPNHSQAEYDQILARLGLEQRQGHARHGNFTVVFTRDFYCNSDHKCPLFVNAIEAGRAVLVTYDGNHLTRSYAEFIAAGIDERLKNVTARF